MSLGGLYGFMGGLGPGLAEGNQALGSAIDRYRKQQEAQRERQALGLIQRSALGGLGGLTEGPQMAPGIQQPDYGPGAVQQQPLQPEGMRGPAPGIPSGTAMAPMQIPSRDPQVQQPWAQGMDPQFASRLNDMFAAGRSQGLD